MEKLLLMMTSYVIALFLTILVLAWLGSVAYSVGEMAMVALYFLI
ncbi:hypothetical protein [Thioflexithrix psekupsensis]|nr:hypothetical protein [Thioflexithrix psekupsensis]